MIRITSEYGGVSVVDNSFLGYILEFPSSNVSTTTDKPCQQRSALSLSPHTPRHITEYHLELGQDIFLQQPLQLRSHCHPNTGRYVS